MKTNPIPNRKTFKTSDNFLRWLRKRKEEPQQAAEEHSAQSARADRRAAMDWADDGGRLS